MTGPALFLTPKIPTQATPPATHGPARRMGSRVQLYAGRAVHAANQQQRATACGEPTELDAEWLDPTRARITCPACIQAVSHREQQ